MSARIRPYGNNSFRLGAITMPLKDLALYLNLPDNCTIHDVSVDRKRSGGIVTVTIESPNLNELPEGSYVPIITLSSLQGYDE